MVVHMMHTQRKEILRCYSGSHLHGTNHELSDEDYFGIFLPSTADVFSLEKEPDELRQSVKKSAGSRNTVGDVDLVLFNLRKFFKLAAEGQSNQLEMLFTPASLILKQSAEFKQISDNRTLFLSKAVEKPFYGFVKSQFNKSIGKSQNLDLIQRVLAAMSAEEAKLTSGYFSSSMKTSEFFDTETSDYATIGSCKIPKGLSDNETVVLEIAGRKFDLNSPIKNMKTALQGLEIKYGESTRKAKESGLIDFKSLSHAIRLCEELIELLEDGHITLPRPNAEYLLDLKLGKVEKDRAVQHLGDLQGAVPQVLQESAIPEVPDMSKVNQLYQSIMIRHFSGASPSEAMD